MSSCFQTLLEVNARSPAWHLFMFFAPCTLYNLLLRSRICPNSLWLLSLNSPQRGPCWHSTYTGCFGYKIERMGASQSQTAGVTYDVRTLLISAFLPHSLWSKLQCRYSLKFSVLWSHYKGKLHILLNLTSTCTEAKNWNPLLKWNQTSPGAWDTVTINSKMWKLDLLLQDLPHIHSAFK